MLRNFSRLLLRNRNFGGSKNGSRFAKNFHTVHVRQIKNHPSILLASAAISGYWLLQDVQCEQQTAPQEQKKPHMLIRNDLPFISEEELSRHDNKYHIHSGPGVDTFDVIGNSWEIEREKRVWVSYGVGVYDITDLIDKHGTPEVTIMLAAGMALDQFWEDEDMAKIHNKPYIPGMMEKCRIGNIRVTSEDE